MSQKSRAIADVSVSGWTPTPVTPRINEASPDGAASYVTNGGINPSGDTFEVKLAALARPEAGSQVLTINLQKTDSGSAPVTVALLQGATVIGEWPVTPTTSFADHCLTLTDTQVAAITDYSNLRVQVTAGGSPSSSSSSSSSESGVVTSCCPDNEIPGTLYATVSGASRAPASTHPLGFRLRGTGQRGPEAAAWERADIPYRSCWSALKMVCGSVSLTPALNV